jgi:hypothetical protein
MRGGDKGFYHVKSLLRILFSLCSVGLRGGVSFFSVIVRVLCRVANGGFFSSPDFHLYSIRSLSSAATVKFIPSVSFFFSSCIHFFHFPPHLSVSNYFPPFKLYAYSNLYTSGIFFSPLLSLYLSVAFHFFRCTFFHHSL